MMDYKEREEFLKARHEALLRRRNVPVEDNGVYERYQDPVVTPEHAPLIWRYDFDPAENPFLLERFGIHATFNAGAIKLDGRYCLMVRVEGADRKSFFAVAESERGVDGFRFRARPVTMPEWGEPATNVYDMRLVAHEPFESMEAAIINETDVISDSEVLETSSRRIRVADTDIGAELTSQIAELEDLLQAYRDGIIREKE